MPTARELLQQADALMRRNRAPVEDADIPELTDVVPESALEHLPVPAAPEDAHTDARSGEESAPTATSEAIAPEGEPSVWLDEAAMGAVSVTGEAPDSILVVAPETMARQEGPEVPDKGAEAPSAENVAATPELLDVRTLLAWDENEAAPEPAPEPAPEAAPEAAPEGELATSEDAEPEAATDGDGGSWAHPVAVGETAPSDLPPVDEMAVEVASPDLPDVRDVSVFRSAPQASDGLVPPWSASIPMAMLGSPGVAVEQEPAPVPLTVPGDALAPTRGSDDLARWEALAEEIRMQVLQRIDIFTDAGLKEQLNERLQPVVDRASAELVGTISLHVGQLLRAYVAEAIEREIEKWRQGGG